MFAAKTTKFVDAGKLTAATTKQIAVFIKSATGKMGANYSAGFT